MTPIRPPARPELTRDAALALLRAQRVQVPALLGRRGYFRDTMGEPGVNDRNLYDDCIVVVTPTEYRTFNANCDPSREFAGVAVLEPGLWWYRLGIHGLTRPKAEQYEALVQAAEVTVRRDQQGRDVGWFGINIHRGGYGTTSSLGCQTIWPDQWGEFIALVRAVIRRHGMQRIPYLLTARADD